MISLGIGISMQVSLALYNFISEILEKVALVYIRLFWSLNKSHMAVAESC